jgi:hypothetical protein
MRPEFLYITIGVLLLLQFPWPKSLRLRFGIRLGFALVTLLLWGCNAGFFISFWGYDGPFIYAFGRGILPLLVLLFPSRPWRSWFFLGLAFIVITEVQILFPILESAKTEPLSSQHSLLLGKEFLQLFLCGFKHMLWALWAPSLLCLGRYLERRTACSK